MTRRLVELAVYAVAATYSVWLIATTVREFNPPPTRRTAL